MSSDQLYHKHQFFEQHNATERHYNPSLNEILLAELDWMKDWGFIVGDIDSIQYTVLGYR